MTPPDATPGDGLVTAMHALDRLPSGYRNLLGRVHAACAADQRIRAAWLGGSVARGVADCGSDLDVLVAVADDAAEGFAARWREWLATVTPTLLAHELPGMRGSFAATTADCLRLDVVTETVSALMTTPYRTRLVVIDRDGLDARIPPEIAPRPPDAARVSTVVDEFYRQQAIFPAAVVARGDWLLGVVAVHNMQVLLYQLFAACNEPLPPMGVKQWSSRLTLRQRAVLAGLPQPTAERCPVISAMGAVRMAFRDAGRRAVEELNLPWPAAVDVAVSDYWRREGLEPSHD